MNAFATFVIFFTVYSFVGWVHELVYYAVFFRTFHKPGFLSLPLLPIYGFGALAIVAFAQPYSSSPISVFIQAALSATVVEYIGALVIEKLFHTRLWEYDKWPLNIHGRVSLFSSLGFGLLGVLLIYIIHPFIAEGIAALPATDIMHIGTVLLCVLLLDFVHATVRFAKERSTEELPEQHRSEKV